MFVSNPYLLRLCALSLTLLASLFCAAQPKPTDVIEITTAQRTVPNDATKNGTIQLSDSWNTQQLSGSAAYQAEFSIPDQPLETWGLYIPRLGNRFSIAINGIPLAQYGQIGAINEDYAQQPVYFTIGAPLLKSGLNLINVNIEGERARYAGLSRMTIGPDRLVESSYRWRHVMQYSGSIAIIALAFLFAVLSFIISRINNDKTFALFAWAGLFCAIRTLYAVVNHLPFDFRLWALLMDGCYSAYVYCLVLFCIDTLQLHQRTRYIWLANTFAVSCLIFVPWHSLTQTIAIRQFWTMYMLIFVACMSIGLIYNWWLKPNNKVAACMGLAAFTSLLVGIHDHWLVYYSSDGYSGFALARFVQVFFLLAMAWVLAEKIQTSGRLQSQMRKQLKAELDEKTKALTATYTLREKWNAQEAHAKERSRLLADLHDGLGLQLNVLLSLSEQEKFKNSDMQQEVQATLEQFRLLIDGSEYFEGTLQELLGHIRYRIEGMLKRCHIELIWDLDFVDPEQQVAPQAAISLQRLVFELSTNVIKHASASTLILQSRLNSDRLIFSLADNGIGFNQAKNGTGKGLRSIDQRIAELQATYSRDATANVRGTAYRIEIPYAALLRS
jgi:signal transduction histidine kinase